METTPLPTMPAAASSKDRTNETVLTHHGATPKDVPSASVSNTSMTVPDTENALKSESQTHIDASDEKINKLTVEERLKRESSSSDLKLLLNFASSAFAHSPRADSKVIEHPKATQNTSKDHVLQNGSNQGNDANGQLRSLTNAMTHSSNPLFLPPLMPKKYTASEPMRMTVLSDYPLGTSYAYNNGHPVPLPYMSSSIPAGPDSVKTLKKEMKKTKFGFKRAAAESAKRTWSEAMAISMSSDNILNPDHKRSIYDDAEMSSSYKKKIKSLPTKTTRSGRETKPSDKFAANLTANLSSGLPTASYIANMHDSSLVEEKKRGPTRIKDKKPKETGHIRGVTQRPSGKWQAQLYYAGKSRYIGVFDSREKANLGYEIAREYLQSSGNNSDDPDKCMNEARKMAFEGVKDFHVEQKVALPVTTGIDFIDTGENFQTS